MYWPSVRSTTSHSTLPASTMALMRGGNGRVSSTTVTPVARLNGFQ